MKNGKHILLITPGFPADENDFNCIPPLQEFLIGFGSRFPTSKITSLALHYPHISKNYKWKAIPVFALGGKTISIKKPFLWIKATSLAKKINEQDSIDLIHTLWLGECALVGNFLSKKFNCPHICTLMGQDVRRTNRYLKFLKNKEIRIVALSKNQSDQFFNLTGRTTDEIIHWGINDEITDGSQRDIDLLAVGSLIPLKNYSLFIRSVEELVLLKPEIKCMLAGSGSEESKLKQMTKDKKLEENIEFTGLLNRIEIFKLMKRSRIFVHPSTFEGSGYVFAEALANGMNIVSFNVGYAQQNAKWFIVKDEQEFINTTKKIILAELDFSPVNLFPLNETVERYAKLYDVN